jgi:hypothetical protein
VSYRDRYSKRYDRNQDLVCSGNNASTAGKICSTSQTLYSPAKLAVFAPGFVRRSRRLNRSPSFGVNEFPDELLDVESLYGLLRRAVLRSLHQSRPCDVIWNGRVRCVLVHFVSTVLISGGGPAFGEILQISIFRTDHWQNLVFIDDNGSQSVPRSLGPLVNWLGSLHAQPHQELNEDESKNNCQSSKKIELKTRP